MVLGCDLPTLILWVAYLLVAEVCALYLWLRGVGTPGLCGSSLIALVFGLIFDFGLRLYSLLLVLFI